MSRSAFTLVELLIALVVIGILMGMSLAMQGFVMRKANVDASRQTVRSVEAVIAQHPRRSLAIPNATGNTTLRRSWDLNEDGVIDGDPRRDPADPLGGAGREFTAAQRAEAVLADYRGLVAESDGLALDKRFVDPDGHILDAWKRPLRIEPVSGIGAMIARVRVWSLGRDGTNNSNDDLSSP